METQNDRCVELLTKNKQDDLMTDHLEERKEDESDQETTFKKPSLPGPRCSFPEKNASSSTDVTFTKSHPEDATIISDQRKIFANELPLAYVEPAWGGIPDKNYAFEVLKSGVILETVPLKDKSYYIVGRLPSCDLSLAHPTISRHHAVLQHRVLDDTANEKGLYVYDLGSTHGTFWNGNRIKPNMYVRLHAGHMLKFGCSQRKYILLAPPEDEEEESAHTVTELKAQRELELQKRALEEQNREVDAEEEEENAGIDWGMSEDADEATDLQENPYASVVDDDFVLDDPKKTLRGWFEREGYDLHYQTEERGIGQFLCWVDLPVESITGRPVRAEATIKGRKKESVVQCALEACKILDKYGLLRQSHHEARKRKKRNWEKEDYYDSDEDNFLDRTGSIEKKREQRMRLAGKLEEKAETYDSLLKKHDEVAKRILHISNVISNAQKSKENEVIDQDEEDALDAFMSSLRTNTLGKGDVVKMKLELQTLRKEEEKLLRLLDLARPANLPPLVRSTPPDGAVFTSNSGFSTTKQTTGIKRFGLHTINKKNSADVTTEHNSSRNVNKISENFVASEDEDDEEEIETEKQQIGNKIGTVETETSVFGKIDFPDGSKITSNESTGIEKVDVMLHATQKNASTSKKRNYVDRHKRTNGSTAKEIKKNSKPEMYDENYSMWLPPEDQAGDGKTRLNEKYGY